MFKQSCHSVFKSNFLLYSLYYAKACNELAGPISASLRPASTSFFEKISQRWPAVYNTVSDLTGPGFEFWPPAAETNWPIAKLY